MGGVGDGFEWYLRGRRGAKTSPPWTIKGWGGNTSLRETLLERHLSWVAIPLKGLERGARVEGHGFT